EDGNPSCANFKQALGRVLFRFLCCATPKFEPKTTRQASLQLPSSKVERSDILDIDKKRYLVPADLTIGQFVYMVRNRSYMQSKAAK
nr:autophagy-related protein 8C [Tanacetum cinerariifolium]